MKDKENKKKHKKKIRVTAKRYFNMLAWESNSKMFTYDY